MIITTTTKAGSRVPGPSPIPVFGWLPWLIRFALSPLSTLLALRTRYGDVVRLGYRRKPAVIAFGPEQNRTVLRDPSVFHSYNLDYLPIPFPRDRSISRVMNSMPFLNGEKHNDHRSYLLPNFHRNFITRYHDSCIDVTRKKLSSWTVGGEVELRSEMERLAMWLATTPILGLDPEKDGEALGNHLEHSMKLMYSPLALLFPYDIPGLPFQRLLKSADRLEHMVRRVIAERKAKGSYGTDILSAMIQLHEQDPERMSEDDLIGQTIMYRGGYSPNGMVLYWTLFLLSQHPDVFENVQQELKTVLDGQNPTSEQLPQLVLLEGVIKETLRLFPAGLYTARYSMQPFELGPYKFAKGTWVLLSAYVTHRIPEIFPEPYKFKPERWLSIHPSAYEFMSFSAGPRYCIGQPLAMMQLKIALSMILQRFSLTLKPGTVVDCAGMNSIRPKHGLPMILHEAGYRQSRQSFKGNVHRIVEFDITE